MMGRLTTLWMLDDFSPENGATLVIPGSHKPSFRENNQGAPETRGDTGDASTHRTVVHAVGGKVVYKCTTL